MTCSFSLDCMMDSSGSVHFTVSEPETITGISGTIDGNGGELTFDNEVLAFPVLADGQVIPVSAPYLLIKTLRGGYIGACGTDGDLLRVQINDSYKDNALMLDIWLNSTNKPVCADILYKGRRYLTLQIDNFTLL